MVLWWLQCGAKIVSDRRKILLGQLGRGGDCLYATAIARQIKQDNPDNHLTWAINSKYRSVIESNPFVDEIWEVPQGTSDTETWDQFRSQALRKKREGEYQEVFLTQVHPGNYQNYDGTVRSSLFRGYPHPINVPVQPVVKLSEKEISNVARFVAANNIAKGDIVFLFESASTSNQSFVTPAFAVATAALVLKNRSDVKFVLSSDIRISPAVPHIIDGSALTFMENAELTKYCSFVVGCSSGLSWLATSNWAKPLPTIQLLSRSTGLYASMIYDAQYFGLPTDNILELYSLSAEKVADIMLFVLEHGFPETRSRFQTAVPINFDFYFRQLYAGVVAKRQFLLLAEAIRAARLRHDHDPNARVELQHAINTILSPYFSVCWERLDHDEREAVSGMLGTAPAKKGRLMRSISGFSELAKASVAGRYSKSARLLLKDTLVRSMHSRGL